MPEELDEFGVAYISAAGFVLALAWWLNLRSFRDLNRAKFKVIGDMESYLPYQPFNEEWKYLRGDPLPWWLSGALEAAAARVRQAALAAMPSSKWPSMR